MSKLLNNFKYNKNDQQSGALEILFDFAIVALVSLIFNGFIINNQDSPFDQKFFMVGNAAILSGHWYIHTFFRQRYEKKNSFFRIWTFIQVFALLMMAVGIDLMAFRMNQTDDSKEFLRWAAMTIFLSGFIFSRLIVAVQFTLGIVASKENKPLFRLGIYKALSRYLTAILASIHFTLIIIYKGDVVPELTYSFIPAYFTIEFLGNVINVNDKTIAEAPKVSLTYAKERYSKLNLLYISSFFISGSIQFAFYFNEAEDINMIGTLVAAYIIGFLLWWSFMDRVYRFGIKQNSRNLKLYAFINVLQVTGLVVIGAMLINAHKYPSISYMVPVIFIGLVVVLISYGLSTITFMSGRGDECMQRHIKFRYIYQIIPAIMLFLALGITSAFFVWPMYSVYVAVPIVFIILNILSRITIVKKVKRA